MFDFIKRHRWAVGGGTVAGAAFLGWLAFGFFGIHTAFIDDRVDDAGPVFASGAVATADAAPADAESDGQTATEDKPEGAVAVETDDGATVFDPKTVAPGKPIVTPSEDEDGADASTGATGATEETVEAAPQVRTIASGLWEGRGRYSSSGDALVLNDGTEQRFLRFENFETSNGPDLFVYLSSADPDSDSGAFDDDFINLGELRGNIGDQNYEIPVDVDLDRYSTVVIWCDRFSALFGVASLAPTGS